MYCSVKELCVDDGSLSGKFQLTTRSCLTLQHFCWVFNFVFFFHWEPFQFQNGQSIKWIKNNVWVSIELDDLINEIEYCSERKKKSAIFFFQVDLNFLILQIFDEKIKIISSLLESWKCLWFSSCIWSMHVLSSEQVQIRCWKGWKITDWVINSK